ncbi:hypothetical protein SCWH03_49260 [Streptomyces pacificus]|uniref:Uncharacterized protein n=1 Tax=Streptomyces pacificus TaxID=2705029 RepID=A0A6A0B2C9_9ACTN|nr:hypothetical protein SCWH03_49260 [Streptomyces pacificus]
MARASGPGPVTAFYEGRPRGPAPITPTSADARLPRLYDPTAGDQSRHHRPVPRQRDERGRGVPGMVETASGRPPAAVRDAVEEKAA